MTENSKRHMDACPYCASELVVAERDDEVGYICEARHRGCGCSFWFSKTNNLEGQVR